MTTAQEVAPYVVEVIEAGPAATAVAFYGQAYRTTSGTVTFALQNTYYDVVLVPTLDAIVSGLAVVSGKFGLENTSGATRIAAVEVEVDLAGSNNVDYGLRLAKGGTAVAPSETRIHVAGTSHVHPTALTWMISLAPGDQVVLQAANFTSTDSLTIARGRIIVRMVA